MRSYLSPGRFVELLAVTALLGLHWGLAVASSLEKSATFDETAHVVAGLFYWAEDDYRFNPESGNLTQRWAALPLLAMDVNVPPPSYPPRAQGNVWLTAREVLYGLGNDGEAMLFAARSMVAMLSVFLGALIYLESRRLFGPRGAAVSLVLYAWSPTMLAHGRMVTADLSAALFFLLALTALGRLLERVTAGRLLGAGLAVAGLVLAKFSWILVLPMAAILVGWRLARRSEWTLTLGAWTFEAETWRRRLALAGVTGLAVTAMVVAAVWAAYGGRFAAAGPNDPNAGFVHSWESRLEGAGPAAPAIRWARDHRVLPEAFLWGLAYTLATTQERDAYLNGEYSATGWRHFFPYAFLVKTPLPLLALLVMAVSLFCAGGAPTGKGASVLALGVLFGVYLASALASSINLGHRHLLPLYPVLFILAGRAGQILEAPWKTGRRRAAGGGVVVLVVLFAVDSWHVRPHYLSYFNSLAGGPENGYRHLVDSSLDWGQDLPALAAWLEENRPETVYAAYFGSAVPEYYGIEARWLHSYFLVDVPHPPLPLRGGTYCVSATLLRTLHTGRPGAWTAAYEAEYRRLREEMERFWERYREPTARPELLAERPPAQWTRLFSDFNRSRSVRLFHALRRRPPDARAGYSILIFHLSDDDVRKAPPGF